MKEKFRLKGLKSSKPWHRWEIYETVTPWIVMFRPRFLTFIFPALSICLPGQTSAADLSATLQGLAGTDQPVYSIPVENLPGPVADSREAPVVFIQYENLLCRQCRVIRQSALAWIQSEYVETGEVALYQDYFSSLGPGSPPFEVIAALKAAQLQGDPEALEAAFWRYGGRLNYDRFIQIIQMHELDRERFDRDYQDPDLRGKIESAILMARENGVQGSPTSLIGMVDPDDSDIIHVVRLGGRRQYSEYQRIIEGLLEFRKSRLQES